MHVSFSGYLREWLKGRFGSPVRLPARSFEQEVLRRSVSRPPVGWQPSRPEADEVAIVLPDDDVRRPEVYCYIGRRGQERLRAALTGLFIIDLWQSMRGDLLRGDGLQEALSEWCRVRGISVVHREAVRQRFYRMRRSYALYGVAAGKKYVKNSRDSGGKRT